MSNSKFIDYRVKENRSEIISNLKTSILEKYGKINRPLKLMHVCGTHESTVSRSGLRSLLPKGLEIISGPGCPVCVCPSDHISAAIELAEQGDIITTFGDMVRVPNSNLQTLSDAKARNLDIRIVYSVSDAIKIAKTNPDKRVIWLGVGFETTAPMTASALKSCTLKNFYVLTDFRLVLPAMEYIVKLQNHGIDGFILPGHVSVITGSLVYDQFINTYHIPCTIGGFSPVDFLVALDKLLEQIYLQSPKIENAYPSVVTPLGNQNALKLMSEVFYIVDSRWRGIGIIPKSGFGLGKEYTKFDAYSLVTLEPSLDHDLMKGCKCGEVILGLTKPSACRFFKKRCTPETPIGPCMVSDEGTCRIFAIYSQEHYN